MKTYSFEDIKALKPCYDADQLRALVGEGLTKEGIAAAPVPWYDRVWVLVRLMVPADIPRFAADVAESVLHLTREQDRDVCRLAIEAARGGDRDAARAAHAAYAAAHAARAAYAAYAAAHAAAHAAYAAAHAARAAHAAYTAAYAAAHAAYAADAAARADAYAAAHAAYAADAAARADASGERSVQIALRYVP